MDMNRIKLAHILFKPGSKWTREFERFAELSGKEDTRQGLIQIFFPEFYRNTRFPVRVCGRNERPCSCFMKSLTHRKYSSTWTSVPWGYSWYDVQQLKGTERFTGQAIFRQWSKR